ncbi:hypothetical protein APED_19180 [Acanthopleuribacter pedis]
MGIEKEHSGIISAGYRFKAWNPETPTFWIEVQITQTVEGHDNKNEKLKKIHLEGCYIDSEQKIDFGDFFHRDSRHKDYSLMIVFLYHVIAESRCSGVVLNTEYFQKVFDEYNFSRGVSSIHTLAYRVRGHFTDSVTKEKLRKMPRVFPKKYLSALQENKRKFKWLGKVEPLSLSLTGAGYKININKDIKSEICIEKPGSVPPKKDPADKDNTVLCLEGDVTSLDALEIHLLRLESEKSFAERKVTKDQVIKTPVLNLNPRRMLFPEFSNKEFLRCRQDLFSREFEYVYFSALRRSTDGLQAPFRAYETLDLDPHMSTWTSELSKLYSLAEYRMGIRRSKLIQEKIEQEAISLSLVDEINLLLWKFEMTFESFEFNSAVQVADDIFLLSQHLSGVMRRFYSGLALYNKAIVQIRIYQEDLTRGQGFELSESTPFKTLHQLENHMNSNEFWKSKYLAYLRAVSNNLLTVFGSQGDEIITGIFSVNIPFAILDPNDPRRRNLKSIDYLSNVEKSKRGLNEIYYVMSFYDTIEDFFLFAKEVLTRGELQYIKAIESNTKRVSGKTQHASFREEYEYLKNARSSFLQEKNYHMWAKCCFQLAMTVRAAKWRNSQDEAVAYLKAAFLVFQIQKNRMMGVACLQQLGYPTPITDNFMEHIEPLLR